MNYHAVYYQFYYRSDNMSTVLTMSEDALTYLSFILIRSDAERIHIRSSKKTM